MPRTNKIGIDYFSLDVDFDTQLEVLLDKFGIIFLAVVVRIWQHIYKNYGYYMPYTEDELYIIRKQCGSVTYEQLDTMVQAMIDKNLFNKDVLNGHKVLTSKRLQQNYIAATRNRANNVINPDYILIPYVRNPDTIDVSCSKSTQRKVNKSKVNKKEKRVGEPAPIEPTIDYLKISEYWNDKMTGKQIPKTLKKMSGSRKGHITARVTEHGIEKLFMMIDLASESNFLNGTNDRGWTANFDWCLNQNNFVKILEGNYINKGGIGNGSAGKPNTKTEFSGIGTTV